MPKPLQVQLSQTEKAELEKIRDNASKAYLRERASALLKIGAGMSASQVADHGLLKRRQYQTVCDWVQRYQAEGVKGLMIRRGRGRKVSFSP
jgi:transposase